MIDTYPMLNTISLFFQKTFPRGPTLDMAVVLRMVYFRLYRGRLVRGVPSSVSGLPEPVRDH